jgi:predicted esterase
MKKFYTTLTLLFICIYSNGQQITSKDLGFQIYKLKDKELGEINYYLSIDSTKTKKPLLVYLDGSGAFPLFIKSENGLGTTIAFDYKKISNKYRILLIGKPGVPFIDSISSDSEQEHPDYYKQNLSLDWRVNSADSIINKLVEDKFIDSRKIVLMGFSEGAQVGPRLAKVNKHISHLLLFGGNGLNQFFDPIINARMKANKGLISESEAQEEVDSLFLEYKKIYSHPQDVEKEWWGHTYKRWASFTKIDPYKDLAELEIPIYIANGSLDENSVLSADYIKLEFIKLRKENLTYKTYPDYDHQFYEIITKDGQFVKAVPKLDEVMSHAFAWLKKQE